MNFSFNLRILAYARRFVRATEDIRDSLDTIARCTKDEWKSKHVRHIHKPSKMAFGTMDVTAINERLRVERELRGEDIDDEVQDR